LKATEGFDTLDLKEAKARVGVAVALLKENGEAHVISPEQFACRSCHHNVTACLHTSHCEGCPAERGLSSNF
jgi:hypothetical protein